MTAPSLHLLLTRPEEDSLPLAELLEQEGHRVRIAPLLEIRRLDDAEVDLDGLQAVLLTSANGARALAARPERPAVPVLCVGGATAEAAREAGFTDVESADGDVDALVRLVKDRLDPDAGALLHVGAAEVAGDLTGRLAAAGYDVRRAVLYEAVEADRLPEPAAEALNEGLDAVLLFSPRSARTFVRLVQAAGLADTVASTDALCLSQAVATDAAGLPWRRVRIAAEPNLSAQIALLEAEEAPAAPAASPASPWTAAAPGTQAAPEPEPEPDTTDTTAAPAEVAAEPAAAPRAAPGPAPTGRSGAGRGLVFVLLALLLFLAGVAVWPLFGDELRRLAGMPAPPAAGSVDPAALEALRQRVDRLEERPEPAAADAGAAAALAEEVDTLRSAVGELAQRFGDLGDRIDALEERPSAPAAAPAPAGATDAAAGLTAAQERQAAEIADLRDRLGEIDRRLADLADTAATVAGLGERVTALAERPDASQDLRDGLEEVRGRVERLAGQLDAVGGSVDRLEGSAGALQAGVTRQALVLAVAQLATATERGAPFAAELDAVADLAGDGPVAAAVEVLRPQAGGVATRRELAERFAGTARDVLAAAPEGEAASWWEATQARLSALVSVRRVGDAAGATPAAVLARAESRLDAGDLDGAVEQMQALEGAAAEAALPWLDAARDRLAVEQAVADLRRRALAEAGQP